MDETDSGLDVDALKKLHEYYKIEEPFSVWYEKVKKDTPDNREYKKKIKHRNNIIEWINIKN